jgi:hypothetical protein
MTADYRALCAELTEVLVDEYGYGTEYEQGLPLTPSMVSDLLTRARAALAQSEPVEPTFAEIMELAEDFFTFRGNTHGDSFFATDLTAKTDPAQASEAFTRAVLQRWGRSTPQPTPVGVTDEALMEAARAAVDTYPRVSELPYFMDPDSSEYEPMLLALRAAAAMGCPALP